MNGGGGGEVLAPWDPMNMNPANMDPAAAAAWRERERRQRSIRMLMMFMLMLLLMDSEDQAARRRNEPKHRKKDPHAQLSETVFGARLVQEHRLQELTRNHPRYKALLDKNKGKNVPVEVQLWAEQQAEIVKDEFVVNTKETPEVKDPEENIKVFHYPWNATGFYRGEWVRQTEEEVVLDGTENTPETKSAKLSEAAARKMASKSQEADSETTLEDVPIQYIDAASLETEMQQLTGSRKDGLGVFLLPPGREVILRYDQNNLTSYDWQRYSSAPPNSHKYYMRSGKNGNSLLVSNEENGNNRYKDDYTNGNPPTIANPSLAFSSVTLTKDSGRAAFQLFSRSVPAMQEISLVDGFLKLYDSNMPGYSTHKDILLRVKGVLIHGIGRMSLVSNANHGRSVLVLGETPDMPAEEVDIGHRHRRLMEGLAKLKNSPGGSEKATFDQVRDDALALFGRKDDTEQRGKTAFELESLHDQDEDHVAFEGTKSGADEVGSGDALTHQTVTRERRTKEVTEATMNENAVNVDQHGDDAGEMEQLKNADGEEEVSTLPEKYTWSDLVIPFPFVLDDEDETLRKTRTPAARKMPPREQLLERNAGICEFEVSMDIKETEWTIGEWRKLVGRRVKETMELNPANKPLEPENEDSVEDSKSKRKQHRSPFVASTHKSFKSARESKHRKQLQDQALIMTMTGSINSPNCDFSAALNVTALRTDWEHTTGKAINYSFYMMLTCLTQIMVLLRQLLHSQAQSAATRVSLLCIGWQTVLDALLCLGHIYLSLAMQPLFTAFASVAFFKLLIFCVIEMKYMALIIQARNSSNGGNTTELLRRQVAMLHLRFYVALFGAFLAFFYAGEKFRIPYNLVLYSFWVPQIVLNVVTEAKRPMHHYYIYGMSLTRLVAPLYVFAEPNNFLKEVYPESPTDYQLCQLLVLWVGFQTAVLIAQGKYGPRFMIPARFLPPKFDYSRPIPPNLLPPGITQDVAPPELPPPREGRSAEPQENQSLLPNDQLVVNRTTGVTTARNRIKGSRARQESSMTTETVVNDTSAHGSGHTLDCVICYNSIDVHNRRGYMLAPCDHIFHKDCLMEWMNVKMECPDRKSVV